MTREQYREKATVVSRPCHTILCTIHHFHIVFMQQWELSHERYNKQLENDLSKANNQHIIRITKAFGVKIWSRYVVAFLQWKKANYFELKEIYWMSDQLILYCCP